MKRGFTLIEFLGVIALISLISLLVIPKILDLSSNSKNEVDDTTKKLIYSATELYISDNEFYKKLNGNKYCVTVRDLVDKDYLKDSIKVNDKDITDLKSVQITYNKGFKYELVDKEDCVEEILNKVYANGGEVYFNVTTGTKCDSSSAVSTTGTKDGCMKFYAFNDSETSSTLNLILDHNTTPMIPWNENGSNIAGPSDTFLNQLKADTDGWQGTITPKNYVMNQLGQTSNASYTINYAGYKARLIEAQEIAQITGIDKDGWNEKTVTASNWYYLDSKNRTDHSTVQGESKYYWLFDYTYTCASYGCKVEDPLTWGYWTASSVASDTNIAWYVSDFGRVYNYYYVSNTNTFGIRPVITISKDKLN